MANTRAFFTALLPFKCGSPPSHSASLSAGQPSLYAGVGVECPAVMEEEQLVHVLVVDDSLIDRTIVHKLLLNASAFKVTTVESGKKALEVLGMEQEKLDMPTVRDHGVNIILTDYCMPEMNGHDLLLAIKEDSHMKSIPVVIMSSEFNPQRISRCLTDGAEEFLQKPLKVKDLEKLRSYVKPAVLVPKIGTKRKAVVDLMPETNEAERRPCLAGVAVA